MCVEQNSGTEEDADAILEKYPHVDQGYLGEALMYPNERYGRKTPEPSFSLRDINGDRQEDLLV